MTDRNLVAVGFRKHAFDIPPLEDLRRFKTLRRLPCFWDGFAIGFRALVVRSEEP
jgi:hypothetical protein